MRHAILSIPLVLAACTTSSPKTDSRPFEPSCCRVEGHAIASSYRVAAITSRKFTHDQLWKSLDPLLRAPAFTVADIGKSMQGRPIRAVSFGTGTTTVLLWSQMHGDESTATMSLADIIAWLGSESPDNRNL